MFKSLVEMVLRGTNSMKILIAEDNVSIQAAIKVLMGMWGYKYDIVSNGLEAVKIAAQNEGAYDLCLMDVDMPIMDGCKATTIIRRHTKYCPIIAVTGNSGFKQKCLDIGMDVFLEKSYSADELPKTIKEVTNTDGLTKKVER